MSPSPTTLCIYCKEPFDPTRGEGDHPLPAALGEFQGDVRFRGACTACNNHIGRSEQQLLQCAPEAFLRRLAVSSIGQPPSRRLRRRGTGPTGGAMGAPSPTFTMNVGGRAILVRPSSQNPQEAEPIDQVVFRDKRGADHQIPLWRKMRFEQLQERMRLAGIVTPKEAFLNCADDRCAEYMTLLRQLWPACEVDELPAMERGVHRACGRIRFTITDHHFRAVAKIGFHYYLAHSRRRLRGDEAGFAALRRFIMEGGDPVAFFRPSKCKFITGIDLGWSPTHWFHLLAAEEVEEVAVVHLQFFVGPGVDSPTYDLRLGSLPGGVVVPSFAWAHQYVYDPDGVPGKAGRVTELVASPFRPVRPMLVARLAAPWMALYPE